MAMIQRIKFDSPDDSILVWKWSSGSPSDKTSGEEAIPLGSQLIVNQSQEALFVKGGQALDLFGPGTHTLTTDNIPLVRRIVNLPFGGETPFTAEVWYVNKIVKRDLTWGTKTPIPVIDPVYGFPVSVRAYGKWGLRVQDSRSFITQIVGSQRGKNVAAIESYFEGEILQRLSDGLAKFFVEQGISIFQANSRLNALSGFAAESLNSEFSRFGIEIVNFNVQSINFPEEEKKRFQEILGRKMEIEQVSQANVGQSYITMRTLDTLEKAAQNEGGVVGGLLAGGIGLGAGISAGASLGQQVGQTMNIQSQQNAQAADAMSKLKQLKDLLDAGLISNDDFEAKKKTILESL